MITSDISIKEMALLISALEGNASAQIAAALPYHDTELKQKTRRMACSFSSAVLVKLLCMLSNVACHVSPLPQVRKEASET